MQNFIQFVLLYVKLSQDKKNEDLQKEKSFWEKIICIFHHFQRAFIVANKAIFLEGESPTATLCKLPIFMDVTC